MILGRVVGEVVSTEKRPQFEGAKLLLVQPETPQGTAVGATLLAIDSVGAGRGELVIAVLEGRAAGEALGKKLAPVDAAIVGIVDRVFVPPEAGPANTVASEAERSAQSWSKAEPR